MSNRRQIVTVSRLNPGLPPSRATTLKRIGSIVEVELSQVVHDGLADLGWEESTFLEDDKNRDEVGSTACGDGCGDKSRIFGGQHNQLFEVELVGRVGVGEA